MLTLFDSALLGAVEGLTEFLPVSSSGHLILARELLHINTESGLGFDAVLQLAATCAALIYFRKDIMDLLRAGLAWLRGEKQVETERLLLVGIIVGTIPALVLGLILQKAMETIFRSALLVACTLILGSILFIYAERKAVQRATIPTVKQSWWIGVFQTLALVPGVSRSGATISGGLLMGLTRESATRFSFLLSLPILAGSGLLKLHDILKHPAQDYSLMSLAVGFLVSGIIGYVAIDWLIKYLKRHSLMTFVWYRLGLAAVVLLVLAIH